MNICVVATAARESGALSIYLQFLDALTQSIGGNHYYFFIDKNMPSPDIEGVTYIRCDTQGWRRVIFDFHTFKRTVKRIGIVPERIVSFQNTAVRYPKVRQIIYFHNLLPLSNHLWNPFSSKERSLFFYTSLYPYYIRSLLRKDMEIVVQADFIRPMFAGKYSHPEDKIHVLRPLVSIGNPDIRPHSTGYEDYYNFIYPAIPQVYKRHDLLADILRTIRDEHPDIYANIRIHLTFKESEYETFTVKLQREQMEDKFVFHGKMPQYELYTYYQLCNALLFPSEMETVGLPLLEAASLGLPIAVTDKPYSREALSMYEGVTYMTCVKDWADFIIRYCMEKKRFNPLMHEQQQNSWIKLLRLIENQL